MDVLLQILPWLLLPLLHGPWWPEPVCQLQPASWVMPVDSSRYVPWLRCHGVQVLRAEPGRAPAIDLRKIQQKNAYLRVVSAGPWVLLRHAGGATEAPVSAGALPPGDLRLALDVYGTPRESSQNCARAVADALSPWLGPVAVQASPLRSPLAWASLVLEPDLPNSHMKTIGFVSAIPGVDSRSICAIELYLRTDPQTGLAVAGQGPTTALAQGSQEVKVISAILRAIEPWLFRP